MFLECTAIVMSEHRVLCPWDSMVIYANRSMVLSIFFKQLDLVILPVTSSTAQGGGGSVKNTNPQEEAGCCQPRMEQRTH